MAKVEEFLMMPEGWSFGEGDKFLRGTIEAARDFLHAAHVEGLCAADVFPGLHGQIILRFYTDDHIVQFVVEEDLLWDVTIKAGQEELLFQDELDFRGALDVLRRLANNTSMGEE